MNKIEFKLTKIDCLGEKKNVVKIFIDSKDLCQLVYDIEASSEERKKRPLKFEDSYEGMEICWYKTYQNLSDMDKKIITVLSCTCLEPGCYPATVNVSKKDNKIIWDNLKGALYRTVDYSALTWEFDKKDYLDQVSILEKEIAGK